MVKLQQGERHVSNFAIEFRTLAAESDWNQSALFDAYLNGLSETLKDRLAPLELSTDLGGLIALSIKIDKRLLDREQARKRTPLRRRGLFRDNPAAPDLISVGTCTCYHLG